VLDKIFETAVEDGKKGVSLDNFHLVKCAVGVARQMQIGERLKKERIEKEKAMEAVRGKLHDLIKKTAEEVQSADEEIVKAEKLVNPLGAKVKDMTAEDMRTYAEKVESEVKDCQGHVDEAKKAVEAIPVKFDGKLEGEIKAILLKDPLAKKIKMQVRRFDLRVARAVNLVSRFRDDAARKEAVALKELKSAVVSVLRYARETKSCSVEDLFKAVDADSDGKIDEDEFVKFLDEADKEVKVRKPKAAAPAKPAEASAEGAEGAEKKEEGAEAAEAAAEEDEFEALKLPEMPEEALRRVFPTLLAEGEEALSQDAFTQLLVVGYFVVAKTTLTTGLGFDGATTVCQLEESDILELVDGPQRDTSSGALRIQAKVAGTDNVGWVTVEGNKGTKFLKEGGRKLRVVKETILTDGLELDADAAEASKLDHQPTKLKVGEILELLGGPQKEEKTGLVRLKAKSKTANAVGWVTFKSSQGVRFLSVLA